MTILRTIKCDVCGRIETETAEGEGWKNWGQLRGVKLDEVVEPALCPPCKAETADFVDQMKKRKTQKESG